jgi:hypothetical protein
MFSSSSPFSKRATPHNICADICMLENLFEKLLEEKANLTHYPSFICGANCIIQVQVPHFYQPQTCCITAYILMMYLLLLFPHAYHP